LKTKVDYFLIICNYPYREMCNTDGSVIDNYRNGRLGGKYDRLYEAE